MAVYVVVGARVTEKLKAAIESSFPEDHYTLSPSCWFVHASATTKELSKSLGIFGGESGSTALVIPVTNYSGYAAKGLWEWLHSRDAISTND